MRFTLCRSPLVMISRSVRECLNTPSSDVERKDADETFLLPPVGGTVLSEPDGGFLAACVCQLEQERRSVARLCGRQAER